MEMTPDLRYVVYSALLTWLMLMVGSMLRVRGWSPAGFRASVGNRETVPPPSPIAGRADRAAANMLENLVLFVALIAVVHLAGVRDDKIVLGARVFFWARVAYFVVYLAGIPYLRTAIWLVSVGGLGLIAAALLGA
jgi:uncharacterized MAPEG superfamily protein